ncbi:MULTISPECIES: MobB mobilization protein [unclassified Thiomonas]|nr:MULTISPECIES: MobB mobilization protein [unclassified Thiomonas]CDW96494.1 Mobilization protein [Thiomonas sp. CB2]SCC95924.1 MobB mobilisation protein [Thiomonas sp. X19]VDY15411.1 MobB mobilisation protein [Thiomonas sp. OC7]VDY19323.1 Mobilization protein [Thiomonas sp. CB2]
MPRRPNGTFAPAAAPRSHMLRVRLTPAEWAELTAIADAAGFTVSDLVRRRALGRPVLATADAALIRELRRQGGLIKHVYETGGAHTATAAQALRAIVGAIEHLSRGPS